MGFEITTAEVWVGMVQDRPGALADKLETVMRGGANLDFVIVRPSDESLDTGVLFVAPLATPEEKKGGVEAGLKKSDSIHALRIVGPDRPGLAAGIARTLADNKINIRGFSAAAAGENATIYLRFDNDDDRANAARCLAAVLG